MQRIINPLSTMQSLEQAETARAFFSIGETAQMIDSTVKTIRYYDEIQLMKASYVNEHGYRFYTAEDIWRLQLIKTLRELRFGIDDIRKLLSGETPIGTSLDWQIETLQTEIQALSGMVDILNAARSKVEEHSSAISSNPDASLSHIHELVNINKQKQQNRHHFVASKMEEIGLLSDVPTEWKNAFFHYFNKYILHPEKLTPKQLIAWEELKKLISSPEFIADLKSVEFLFVSIAMHPRYEAKEWIRLMQSIQKRLSTAMKKSYAADSPYVQNVVEDALQLYTHSNMITHGEELLKKIQIHIDKLESKNFKRSIMLCSILSPEFQQLAQRDQLLFQGLRWRLQQI